jgi:hypothetical protein
VTGPIPIADIKASMVAAGIDPNDADAWITEVRFAVALLLRADVHWHGLHPFGGDPGYGDGGRRIRNVRALREKAGADNREPGNTDTYTFDATLSGNELSLRCVDSTEQGTAADKAKHRRYTIAFYRSAPFRRQH